MGVVLRLSCATVMLASPLAVWAQTPGSAELDPTAPLDPMPDIGVEWPDMTNPYEGDRRAGTVGVPFPGVSARLVDDDGNEVPGDGVGEVQVRGPSVLHEMCLRETCSVPRQSQAVGLPSGATSRAPLS